MPKNKWLFQAKWLDDTRYSQLLKKNNEVALCSSCKKEIDIGSTEETALMCHLEVEKHQEISKLSCSNPITSLLKKAMWSRE